MEGFNGSDMERNEMKSKGIKREGNASPGTDRGFSSLAGELRVGVG